MYAAIMVGPLMEGEARCYNSKHELHARLQDPSALARSPGTFPGDENPSSTTHVEISMTDAIVRGQLNIAAASFPDFAYSCIPLNTSLDESVVPFSPNAYAV